MWASHKKDINRHKSFHPLTYVNQKKVEDALAAKVVNEKATAERKANLRREREDDLFAELQDVADGRKVQKGRRVDWLFSAETHAHGAATSSSPAETVGVDQHVSSSAGDTVQRSTEERPQCSGVTKRTGNSSVTARTEAPTGRVTAAEVASAKYELEKLQKARNDPLAKVLSHRNAVVADAAKALKHSSATAASTSTPEAAASDNVKLRLQKLLEQRHTKGA